MEKFQQAVYAEKNPQIFSFLEAYTIGQKFGITPLKQTLWYESTRNGQAKMPLGRIRAPFVYASDEHNTVSVAKTVQELEAEN